MIRETLRTAKRTLMHLGGASGMASLAISRQGPHYIAILVYHQVAEHPGPGEVSVSSAHFEQHIKELRNRYDVWKLQDIVSAVQTGQVLPPVVIAITFDDGYRNVATHAYPILKQYDVPASIFLVSGLIGTDDMMWTEKVQRLVHLVRKQRIQLTHTNGTQHWDVRDQARKRQAIAQIKKHIMGCSESEARGCMEQLAQQADTPIDTLREPGLMMTWDDARNMDPSLIEFGSHTVTHPVMTALDRDTVMHELTASKAQIEHELGRPVAGFTYPNDIHAPWMRECVDHAGYSYACEVGGQSVGWPAGDHLALPRIHVENWGKSGFLGEISPIGEWIRVFRKKAS